MTFQFVYVYRHIYKKWVLLVDCKCRNTVILTKAATGWSVFASGVDLGRSRVLSGPPDRR